MSKSSPPLTFHLCPQLQLLGKSSDLHVQQSTKGHCSFLLLFISASQAFLVLLTPPPGLPPTSILCPQQSASRWADCFVHCPRIIGSVSAHRLRVLHSVNLHHPGQQADHSGLVGDGTWECELPPHGGRGGSSSALWREAASPAAEE